MIHATLIETTIAVAGVIALTSAVKMLVDEVTYHRRVNDHRRQP